MIGLLRHIDYSIFHFINHDLSNSFLDFLCPVLREKLVWLPAYALAAFYFFKNYGSKTWWLIIAAIVTIILSDQLSSSMIKPVVHRLRPCNNPDMRASVRLVVDTCGSGFSFVSSHAANHFAIASFLSFWVPNKKLLVPCLFLWAAAVALSQVYVGVHFPADVAGGAILGCVIGGSTGFAAKKYIL